MRSWLDEIENDAAWIVSGSAFRSFLMSEAGQQSFRVILQMVVDRFLAKMGRHELSADESRFGAAKQKTVLAAAGLIAANETTMKAERELKLYASLEMPDKRMELVR